MCLTSEIIIVNYNSTEYTLRCIDSVKRHINSCDINIIVIDNNSVDMPDRIRDQYPDVNLIKNKKNIGFGKAINYALKSSQSKYVILINPDAVIIDSSFNKIFKYLDGHPEVAVLGPMIKDQDGSMQGSARRFPTIWTSIFGRKSPLTKLFPSNPISKREFVCFNGELNKPQTVDWVSGACMIIRREAIMQVGGFDERYFMYWEDADLCKRIKENNWDVTYYPKAQIYHHIGKSSDTRPLMSIYHFHKSCYYYFTKHTGWPIKIITPFAFLGLGLRCLFVMGLNLFQQMLGKMKPFPLKIRQRGDANAVDKSDVGPNINVPASDHNLTVSIITAVKNCEKTIEATIQSVKQQSYPAIEHIIIDGASSDNTNNILDKYKDCFSVLISESDEGIYDAMNKGLEAAKGDIIGFLNADDVFADNDIVADVVHQMTTSGKDAVFGDLVYVQPNNLHRIVRYYDSSGFTKKWLRIGAMPAHPTLYLKKNIYDIFGKYKTDYLIAADFEFMARIFGKRQTSYSYLPKVMVKMRTGGVSTKNLMSNWVLNKEMLRACRQNNIPTNILKLLLKYPKKVGGIIRARKQSLKMG